ncbi:MAG: L,D-transpeptidase [Jatrophihabitans sp.]
MDGQRNDHLRATTRRVAVASLMAVVGLAAACTSSAKQDVKSASPSGSHSSVPADSSGSPSSAKPVPGTAVITAAAVGGATRANPAKPVLVHVTDGKLTAVKLVNAAGKLVTGNIAADGSSWQTTEALGYSKTYKLTASAHDQAGRATVKQESITTLTPGNQTMPYFQNISGDAMSAGATYGIGMVVNVDFDEAIHDKAAAEKAMTVTTTPHVNGAWYWLDDSRAHWRPQSYYAPGTKVTVNANVYGVDLGNGLYGQDDKSTSFTIGQKRVSIANAATHRVKVYFDDKQVRDMPTSMGQGGYIENGKIALWTMPGNYTVITHENPAIMSSDSYGLPANSPYGYHGLVVPWATKISTDGIYLHELDSTVGVQGSQNVSHGCLNLNYTNAKWYYQHSRVGDVVQVVHSGGPKIKDWQGGDWSVPWSTWIAGGAQ